MIYLIISSGSCAMCPKGYSHRVYVTVFKYFCTQTDDCCTVVIIVYTNVQTRY